VSVYGLGRAGRALLRELQAAAVPLGTLWNRTPIDLPDRPVTAGAPPESTADIVLLAVRDAALDEVAATLPTRPGQIVLHLSGVRGGEALSSLPDTVHRGGFHPLQSFGPTAPPTSELIAVPPYQIALDGDEVAVNAGRNLAARLGHESVLLPPGSRAAYHAAAVLTAGGLVALLDCARQVLVDTGIDPQKAWPLLRPLALGTMRNLLAGDAPSAMTGPIARGDADTVRRNLDALGEPARSLYVALAEAALKTLHRAGREGADHRLIADLIRCEPALRSYEEENRATARLRTRKNSV
jgi:predicted short-subunit dehydrogenase-like oxidoreductase (DUF2520 family)